ncbi:MAG: diguanylate cyclase, partial [Candidatus Competibacteraceae bacterium]|nr:diguanylate cyclase [Candidatus Competibacteraceae bacterium]
YCELFRNIPTHEKRKIIEAVETAAATGKMVSVEHQLFPAQGPELYISHTIQVIGSNGYIHRLNGTVQDITDRKKADARIRSLAYVDQLTGLANRVFLKEYLKSSLAQARRKQESLALLYLDLDDFKHVNDTLGHSAGDTLLREVAKRLKYCTRDSDTLVRDRASLHTAVLGETLGNSIARLGGDEFIIVLNSIEHVDNVLQVAQRITEALAQPFEIDQQAVRVTSSIGISLFPNDGEDEETLFKNADMAMYHAKGTGKNNFQFFTARINQVIVNRLTLERNLRTALDRDQLFLQYQPKFDLASGQISGLEALLRWRHPTRGIVGPTDFITFAEECGFIVPIGEWVIHTVCQQQRAWQDAGLPAVRIALNLSVRQIRDH